MSNNYCTIELPKGKVFEALERQKGANIDKTREIVLTVYDNGEFKDEFKIFCKNNNFKIRKTRCQNIAVFRNV